MFNAFDKLLGFHCAPTLMGIKAANLICCAKKEYTNLKELLLEYNTFMNSKGIYVEALWETVRCVMILIYQKKTLVKILKSLDVINFLKKYGYKNETSIQETLEHLRKNVNKNGDFPHEIGIFLGYPLEDVEGFIKNNGKNCQACGFWKVYSDPENKIKLFEKYAKCRKVICRYLDRGTSIRQLLEAV